MRCSPRLILVVVVLLLNSAAVHAQTREDDTVLDAAQVLKEVMAIPARAIPAAILRDAQAIAIVPGLLKGGFVVGIKHGEGVIVTRDDNGTWHAPSFISVTGGSFGWQAGIQSTDVVMVFRTRTSVERLMRGKFTIGADAAVAAGPIGRDASAATDGMLKAEILSYSRSRGLFVGLAIDGAVLLVDGRATAAYYAPRPGLPAGTLPGPAARLMQQVLAVVAPPPP